MQICVFLLLEWRLYCQPRSFEDTHALCLETLEIHIQTLDLCFEPLRLFKSRLSQAICIGSVMLRLGPEDSP